ncbi:MAG: hypothetical protein AAGA48_30785 [Myxococcota bacterium]
MSPYLITLLLDQLSIVLFAVGGGVAAVALARRGQRLASGLLGLSALATVGGLGPVVVQLLSGDGLSSDLPGLAMVEVLPWWTLAALVMLRPAPGPRDLPIDAMSLGALALALAGVPGFCLGLALLVQGWLRPGLNQRRVGLAIVQLIVALAVDHQELQARDVFGRAFGLSADAQVWGVDGLTGVGLASGWLTLTRVLVSTKETRRRPRATTG